MCCPVNGAQGLERGTRCRQELPCWLPLAAHTPVISQGEEGVYPPRLPSPSPSLPVTCKAGVVTTAFSARCQHGAAGCTLCDRLTVLLLMAPLAPSMGGVGCWWVTPFSHPKPLPGPETFLSAAQDPPWVGKGGGASMR